MNIHEYQAKQLLARYGVAVPFELPAKSLAEVRPVAEKIAASGSAKTMPKHVKAAQEARTEAGNEPPQVAPAKKVRRDWQKEGPKLLKQVESFIGNHDIQKGAKKLIDYYEANFGA